MGNGIDHPTAVRLRKARSAMGVDLDEVHRVTRIARRYLEALEAGEFERCPAEVYARGFIRIYARYLNLDPDRVLLEYDEFRAASAPESKADGNANSPLPLWRRLGAWPNKQPDGG
ncbi:MAG: helix-turn-helix domain-containing protein [Firmicutes bacterium]|nr:helix-turn-helix domain-containing protein [Bacillota bacterium]